MNLRNQRLLLILSAIIITVIVIIIVINIPNIIILIEQAIEQNTPCP
ncbi:MAG: hypothetical protein ACFFBP_05150 [Promethearchaeota archaeon]